MGTRSTGLSLLIVNVVFLHSANCLFPQFLLNDIRPDINNLKNDGLKILRNRGNSLKFINHMAMMKGVENEDKLLAKNTFKKPWFCHGLDCPEFAPMKGGDGYEAREYVDTKWFSTALTGKDLDEADMEMFGKLFKYIEGENSKKEKIAMTSPVINRIIPGQGPACEDNFTMSFFNSLKETDPPKPTDASVFFSELPKQKVYVSSFSGYASEEKWLKYAEKLGNALKKDDKTFVQEFFFTAGYDSPFRILERHNEVWFIAKD